MKSRCLDPNAPHYDRYGGRGIRVCPQWVDSFDQFLTAVGARPSLKHTLERMNNDGHYEPGNIRWATRKEQAQNRANNRLIRYDNEIHTVAQWVDMLGLDDELVRSRLKLRWPFDKIVRIARQSKEGVGRRTASGRYGPI